MHKLISYVCDELEELERKADKGKLSMAELQYGDMLAHMKKNLMKAEEMSDEGYSERMYPYGRVYADGRSYEDRSYNDRSYTDGRSYARKRDSMGRYSRGYSMATEDMTSQLREMMKDAPDERTRGEFQRFIEKIESM